MHILFLVKTSQGARWAIELIKEVKRVEPSYTFSVVLPVGGKFTDEYFIHCRNVYNLSFDLNIDLIKNGIKLKEFVKLDKPDIIHSWFTQTTLYARLFLRDLKIPRLFQVVGPLHLESFSFKWMDILSAQSNDFWIGTSKYILHKYSNTIDENKLFLNYPLVDTNVIAPNEKSRNLRKEFSIPDNHKIIGTASYFYPPKWYQKEGVKGHEYLLSAFQNLLKKRQDVSLIISGKTFGTDLRYEKKIHQMAKEISDQIYFTGGYNHVNEVIYNFDLFVYLSTNENMGGVFESLLHQIPTISSNRGALPELVQHGVTGFVVDLNNLNEITDTMLLALDHNNSDVIAQGFEKVKHIFDPTTIVAQAIHIYNSVL